MKIMKAVYRTDSPSWLVCLAPDEAIYAYLQRTNQFHYSHPLTMDYRWDKDFDYPEINSEEASALIEEGIGILPDSEKWIEEKLSASELRLSAHEVLSDVSSAIARDEGEETVPTSS